MSTIVVITAIVGLLVIATVVAVHKIALFRGLSMDDEDHAVLIASGRCVWPIVAFTIAVVVVMVWATSDRAPVPLGDVAGNVATGAMMLIVIFTVMLVADFFWRDRSIQLARAIIVQRDQSS